MALGMRGAERQDSARAALDSAGTDGHAHPRAAFDHRARPPPAATSASAATRRWPPKATSSPPGSAHTLRAELDELPHDDLRLLSSSALRCRQTADGSRRCGRRSDVEVEVHPGLLELDYGAWDGLTADECQRSRSRAAHGLGGRSLHDALSRGRERRRTSLRRRLRRPRSDRGVARGGPGALRDRDRPQPRQPPATLRAVRLADARVPRPAVAGSGGVQHRRARWRDARRPPRQRGAGLTMRHGPCVGTAEPEP